MNLQQLFDDLSNMLMKRSVLITEDTLRYYLYICMTIQDKKHNNYIMEMPYQEFLANPTKYSVRITSSSHLLRRKNLLAQELDMYYNNPSADSICIELKFHRIAPHSSYAHTSAAGLLFNDLKRLNELQPTVPDCNRLLVYLTDDVMGNYLKGCSLAGKNGGISNPVAKRELLKLYNPSHSPFNINLSHPGDAPASFFKASSSSFSTVGNISLNIDMVYTNDFISPALAGNCHLRVYRVN